MDWQQLYTKLLEGETVTVRFDSDARRNLCRTYLSKLRREGSDLLVLMDMQDTKLEMRKLDDEGKYSIRFAPKDVKRVPFQIIED